MKMKIVVNKEKIKLQPRQDWFLPFIEQVDSDKLFYEINYNLTDENKTIFAELVGVGTSKLIRIDLNTTKGVKNGEFNTNKPFANIYFKVEKIRFYCDSDLEFELSVFENELNNINI